MLPEAANAVGLRFTGVGLYLSRLPFDPVALLEEPERLLRRAAAILSRLEGINEAPPGVSHASDIGAGHRPGACLVGDWHHDTQLLCFSNTQPC